MSTPYHPTDHDRALVALRCLDGWSPEPLGPASVVLARALAEVPGARPPDRWTGDGSTASAGAP